MLALFLLLRCRGALIQQVQHCATEHGESKGEVGKEGKAVRHLFALFLGANNHLKGEIINRLYAYKTYIQIVTCN